MIPFIIILKIRHFFINPVSKVGCVFQLFAEEMLVEYEVSFQMPFRALGEPPKSSDYLDSEIFHFCGIFTVFSIVVSIYTLTSSSIDRYLAVRFPIKYKPGIHEPRTTGLASDTNRKIVSILHRSWIPDSSKEQGL